jgi:hypothetical protein
VSWRQRIAIVVVFVLASSPVGTTMCAIRCSAESAGSVVQQPARHHCAEAASANAASRMDADVPADCGTHDSDREQVATSASERVRLGTAYVAVSTAVHGRLATPIPAVSVSIYTAPPGTDPPTTIPLVLRV